MARESRAGSQILFTFGLRAFLECLIIKEPSFQELGSRYLANR